MAMYYYDMISKKYSIFNFKLKNPGNKEIARQLHFDKMFSSDVVIQ